MPWNGAGLFTRLRSWVTDQTNGLSIQADLMDTDTNDIAAGIQACLAKNGENAPTANLPMGGYKHTGVADGTARAHYASLGQVQDGSATYCVAGGTANSLTLSYSPAITALVNGQELRFRASATCAAGATTAAVNGIAAKSLKREDGADPAAGDITSGREYVANYNSTSDTLVFKPNALLATGGNVSGRVTDTEVVLTAVSNTFTINASAGNDFICGSTGVISASSTLANPTNLPPAGTVQPFSVRWKQDGTGGRTMSFGANWVNIGGSTANTSANKWNVAVGKIYPDGTVLYSIAKGV